MTATTTTTTNSSLSDSNNASLMSAHHHHQSNDSSYHGGRGRHHQHNHHSHHHHHQPPHHKEHMFMKKRVFMRTFDLSQIAEDPMDNYLDTLGLWKKRIARDGSCLFRAVAEQIYPCQMYHEKVRLECIQYMSEHKEDFSKHLTSISFEDYIEAMKNPFEYGGQLEIAAMSKLYRRDFIIYQAPDQAGIDVTLNGFPLKINLCYSYNHFDAIFTKEHRDRLALIQSLVYEILYDQVFGSGEQVSVARRLLRKSDTIYPKEYMNDVKNYDDLLDHELYDEYEDSDEIVDEDEDADDERGQNDDSQDSASKQQQSSDINNNSEQVVDKNDESKKTKKPSSEPSSGEKSLSLMQKMPLPYKVAKSLDPVIYRNTAFDAWLAAKREHEDMVNLKAIAVLQPGDKCLVRLTNGYGEKWNTAYIHNLHSDSANVFIADLNEHHFVSLDNLKAYSDAHHHYHGPGGDSKGHHGSQNVQKLVQSINQQFSKIFVNSDNKRRNLSKKKQFSMVKKSSSFHAFSTELPPLPEVNEEQLEDAFHYASLGYSSTNPGVTGAPGGRYYFNTQMHPHHPNPHGMMMGSNASGHHHHHQHQTGGNGGPYYSMPHSQSQHTFHDAAAPPPASSGSKQVNAKSSSLPNSASNPNIRSGSSGASKMPPSQQQSSSGSFAGKNRRQRYAGNTGFNQNVTPNTPNSNNSYLGYPNTGAGVKGAWNGANSSSGNSFGAQTAPLAGQYPMQPVSQNSVLQQQQQSAPAHGHHQQNSSFGGGAPPPLPGFALQPPPLAGPGPHMHPPNGSMQPPPPNGSSYMPHPPHLAMGPHLGQQRPGYFNPPSNMFQQPIGHMAPSLLQHPPNTAGYYFPPGNQPPNLHNHNSSKSSNDRKRNDNFNNSNFSSKTQQSSSASSSSNSTSTATAPAVNTSNYLLMPVPNSSVSGGAGGSSSLQHSSTSSYSNLPGGSVIGGNPSSAGGAINSSSNNMSRSHSYHGAMAHDNAAAAGYMDVQYQQAPIGGAHLPANSATNAGNSLTAASNLASGCLNNLGSAASNNAIGNLGDLGASSYTSSFNNYDAAYPRFDSSTGSTGANTLIDENLLNSVSQTASFNDQRQQPQNIVWNKSTKFGKNNSLFASDGGAYSSSANSDINNNNNPNAMPPGPFFYSNNNCFVVNIEGPINFNATHSLLDDGSDLPMNDVNTIRFFYNLGIEYYRLNIAPNPYQQQQLGNYAGCYLPPGAQLVPPQAQGLPPIMAPPPMAQDSSNNPAKAKNEPKLKDNSA